MKKWIKIFVVLGILLAFSYFFVRLYFYLFLHYTLADKIIGGFLLFAEFFIVIHGTGYLFEILLKKQKEEKRLPFKKRPVAIVIPSYNEPLSLLRDTITSCYNIAYDEKQIYLLDDTRYDLPWDTPEKKEAYKKAIEDLCKEFQIGLFRRVWRGAKAGIINDFLSFIEKKPKKGTSCVTFGKKPIKDPVYLAVFDADQNPFPDFLDSLVEKMERHEKLAFIQTPQYYTNFLTNRVARAAGLQQVIFYEYICEGKNVKEAMFACGTNLLLRISALIDVGGFEEKSVTEDFATSLKFHLKGYKTAYMGKAMAFGRGPEDLGNYFKQQFRWALGTLGQIRPFLKALFTHPLKLPMKVWWEYFLSSTYYLMGFIYFILMLCPVIYLFFGVPSYFLDFRIYGAIFLPYFIVVFLIFYGTLRQKGYRPKDLFLGQVLAMASFPLFVKAGLYALFNKRGKFEVTKKEGSVSLSLLTLWPQLFFASLCAVSIFWGVNRIFFEGEHVTSVLVNMFWSFINGSILFTILYFNQPEEVHEASRISSGS